MLCPQCLRRLDALPSGRNDNGVAAAFPYEGVARDLVVALKFRGATACARLMAGRMRERLGDELADADWIVPVPAHPARRRRRGFNQSLLLARALGRGSDARVVDCLAHDATAPPQSELSRAERLALPAGTFHFKPPRPGRRACKTPLFAQTNVVVCDDVVTTGVTLEACAQAIRDGRPEYVTAPVPRGPIGTGRIRAAAFASAGRRG